MREFSKPFGVAVILFGALIGALATEPAHAGFEITPIVNSVAPSGEGATTTYTVTNLGNSKTPIQLFIVAREPDVDGKETYKKDDPKVEDLFRVHPSQFILEPNEKRSVRVTWIGDARITKEIPFRLLAEDLPIDLDDPKKKYTTAVAKIMIATQYVGSLYVRPASAKPNLEMTATPNKTSKGTEMILDVTNTGTAHQILRRPKIKLLAGKSEILLDAEPLKGIQNQNILAGKSRKFTLPWPSQVPVGPVKVKFEIAQE